MPHLLLRISLMMLPWWRISVTTWLSNGTPHVTRRVLANVIRCRRNLFPWSGVSARGTGRTARNRAAACSLMASWPAESGAVASDQGSAACPWHWEVHSRGKQDKCPFHPFKSSEPVIWVNLLPFRFACAEFLSLPMQLFSGSHVHVPRFSYIPTEQIELYQFAKQRNGLCVVVQFLY